jgi:hypothetical protein
MKNIFRMIYEYFECKRLRKELIIQKEDEVNLELELLRLAYNKAYQIGYDHTKANIIERTYRQGLDSYEALHELERYKGSTNTGVCEDIAFAFLKETMKIRFKHFHIESKVGYITDNNNPHAWVEVMNINSRKRYKVDPTWKIFMEPL